MVTNNYVQTLGTKANTKIRILLRYEDKIRKLLWFEVKSDRSMYFSAGPAKVTKFGTGIKENPGRIFTLEEKLYKDLPKERLFKGIHFSVHSSGVLRMGDFTSRTVPLARISKQELLAVILYQHPSTLDFSKTRQKHDVILNFPVDEKRLIWTEIYVAPIGKEKYVTSRTVKGQINIIFQIQLQNNDGISIYFTFADHIKEEKWPKQTYFLFPREEYYLKM